MAKIPTPTPAGHLSSFVSNAVCLRALYECERCGADDGLKILSRLPAADTPPTHNGATVVQLCHCCATWLRAHPVVAVSEGWLVPTTHDPLLTPVVPISVGAPVLLGLRYRRPQALVDALAEDAA